MDEHRFGGGRGLPAPLCAGRRVGPVHSREGSPLTDGPKTTVNRLEQAGRKRLSVSYDNAWLVPRTAVMKPVSDGLAVGRP